MVEKIEIERKYDVLIQGVGVEPTAIDYLVVVKRSLSSCGLLFRSDIAYTPTVEHYFFNPNSGKRRRLSEYENGRLISTCKFPIDLRRIQVNREVTQGLEDSLEEIKTNWKKQGLLYLGKLQKRRAKTLVSSYGIGYELCFDLVVGRFGQTRQMEVELCEEVSQKERIITTLNTLHHLIINIKDLDIPKGENLWTIKRFIGTNKPKWKFVEELNGV